MATSVARKRKTAAKKSGDTPAKVERPAFVPVAMTGDDVSKWAQTLGSVETDVTSREAVGSLFTRSGSDLSDGELSLLISAAARLDRSNVIGQGIVAEIVSREGRGAPKAYAQALGIGESAVSKRRLLGQAALLGVLPADIRPEQVSSAIGEQTAEFRKILTSGQTVDAMSKRMATKVRQVLKAKDANRAAAAAARQAAEQGGAVTPQQGGSETVTKVTGALALLSPESFARMTDAEFTAVGKAIEAAGKRWATAQDKRASAAA